jgi:hypothetical protein
VRLPLAEYYCADGRLLLLPIEHLTPVGMSPAFATLAADRGWSDSEIRLFDAGFSLYWSRSVQLAARSRGWPPPRIRHVAVVTDPLSVRPYAQLLNTSAWTLYRSDLDAESSDPELVSYLLVQGDRMAILGEVSLAPLHCAAYWFDRSDTERAAFARAARNSTRPDAGLLHAVAEATDWLRQLFHETLRPSLVAARRRTIPGTGLSVPEALAAEPQALTDRCAAAAGDAVAVYRAAWSAAPAAEIEALCAWLRAERPELLIAGNGERILWDPAQAQNVAGLRAELERADAAAVAGAHEDLAVIDRHTRAFRIALVGGPLPELPTDTGQSGYTYLHRERRLIAYNLHEEGMERLCGPPLPYGRAMLGARTAHEWAHLAVAGGCVPCVTSDAELTARRNDLASELDATIAAAAPAVRARTEPDLTRLGASETPGTALARLLLARMPDYQSNVLAWPFLNETERETYVRHNIRSLRAFYAPAQLWRMLLRYLFEFQYLAFSAVEDPRTYFFRSTWFDADYIASGALDARRFDELSAAVSRLCACHAIDESRVRLPESPAGRR